METSQTTVFTPGGFLQQEFPFLRLTKDVYRGEYDRVFSFRNPGRKQISEEAVWQALVRHFATKGWRDDKYLGNGTGLMVNDGGEILTVVATISKDCDLVHVRTFNS